MPQFWLMKTEPETFSITDLERVRLEPWTGVRSTFARFHMRAMAPGDGVLFYHSSCPEPGIAGLAEVASAAYPDKTQFDRKSDYFDAQSKKDRPRWFNVDVRALKKTRLLSLQELKAHKPLAKMVVLRPGNRLSITPVTEGEWKYITGQLL